MKKFTAFMKCERCGKLLVSDFTKMAIDNNITIDELYQMEFGCNNCNTTYTITVEVVNVTDEAE